MKTLVITPMREELKGLLRGCEEAGFHTEAGSVGKLPVTGLPDLGLTAACGGTGKVQFAVQARHLLDCAAWDLVICAGAAGALVDDVSVGDVVVATVTVEHDYGNKFNARPLPRFPGSEMAISGLQRVSSLLSSFRVHFGPIASGDEDVMSEQRKRELHGLTGALVVAWEGAGGARACRFSKVPFVEMRGVTDRADQSAAKDFETNLAIAMRNISRLLTSWLRRP